MRVLVVIVLFSFVLVASEARIVERCEIATKLRYWGLDGYLGYTLGDWLCIIFHESGYNTKPPLSNTGDKLYGLFKFNHRFWCSDGVRPTKNQCNIACQKLIDDEISDDILCAKKVLELSKDLRAWPRWQSACRGKNLSSYLQGCRL